MYKIFFNRFIDTFLVLFLLKLNVLTACDTDDLFPFFNLMQFSINSHGKQAIRKFRLFVELMRSPSVRWPGRNCRSLSSTPTPGYQNSLYPPLPAVGMVAERKKRFEL